MKKLTALSLFLLAFLNCLLAQDVVEGKVYYGETDSLLSGVTVRNRNLVLQVISDSEGKFTIAANEGDILLFSYTDFKTDTVKVAFHMLRTPVAINLAPIIKTLENVTVTNRYVLDSLERRFEYKDIFKQQNITGGNRPESGFGVSFSPISYFSKKAKQQRKLKKKLLKQDEEDYVDMLFSGTWVSQITGLKGEDLNLFMYKYRPSYEYCRKVTRADLVYYINDKLKEFQELKKITNNEKKGF